MKSKKATAKSRIDSRQSRHVETAAPSNGNAKRKSAANLRELTQQFAEQEVILREGGGPAGQARQRKLGRLPVRERLQRLLDPGAPFIEIGLWAAFGMYEEVGGAVA